ncbi:MAG: hypothetical protein AABZ08_03960 [Planctomycetota bacterium]
MNRHFHKLVMACACLAAVGCIPEKRIVWSPNGKTAAVCTPNGLFLIDEEGKPLPAKVTGSPTRCAWFKDSKRLVVVHAAQAKGWDDIAPLFDDAQRTMIAAEAKKTRERILAHDGPWNQFQLDPNDQLSPGMETAIFMFLRDKDNAGIADKLKEEWEGVAKATASIWQVQVFGVSSQSLTPGPVLTRSLDEIRTPKISPKETAVTFPMTAADARNDDVALHVVSLTGGLARPVAAPVGLDFDWSPDGCDLVFIRSTSTSGAKNDESLQLGSLTTMTVADASGALLPQWGPRKDLVGMLFSPVNGVRWLRDGRILFAAAEVTLPATSRDMPRQWSLFIHDPRTPASVVRALGRDFPESLDPGLAMFEVSPNEELVLLPSPKGRISLYDFRNGTTTAIQAIDDPDGKVRCIPSWKNDTEISMVAASESANGAKTPNDVLIWSNGKTKKISDGWSDEMREGWMDGK